MTQTATSTQVSWLQLTLQVPERWAEDASAVLIEAGALGVQTVGGHSSEPVPSFAHAAITAQSAASAKPGKVILVASYRPEDDPENIKREARDALAGLQVTVDEGAMQVVRRNDSGWADRWKQYFKPLKVGRRLWVVPSWDRTFEAPSNTVVLTLDPGMAFGTGQHATTALCLKAIELYAERLLPNAGPHPNMLDVGCGSGILAMGAAKLGFVDVLAVDNDPEAVAATRENVKQNGLEAQVRVADTAVDRISDRFTLVVANILAQPLIDMAGRIAARVKPGGILVLSGLLNSQADAVQRAYENTDFMLLKQRWTHGEWSALALCCVGKSLEQQTGSTPL